MGWYIQTVLVRPNVLATEYSRLQIESWPEMAVQVFGEAADEFGEIGGNAFESGAGGFAYADTDGLSDPDVGEPGHVLFGALDREGFLSAFSAAVDKPLDAAVEAVEYARRNGEHWGGPGDPPNADRIRAVWADKRDIWRVGDGGTDSSGEDGETFYEHALARARGRPDYETGFFSLVHHTTKLTEEDRREALADPAQFALVTIQVKS